MTVEQNLEFLNEIADAGERDNGDAHHAWSLLLRSFENEQPLPAWAKAYFIDAASKVRDFDPDEQQPEVLVQGLGFYGRVPGLPSPSKSYYDDAEIFAQITARMREARRSGEKSSVSKCIVRYVEDHGLNKLPDDDAVSAVKAAYYRVRKKMKAGIEQDRPHL